MRTTTGGSTPHGWVAYAESQMRAAQQAHPFRFVDGRTVTTSYPDERDIRSRAAANERHQAALSGETAGLGYLNGDELMLAAQQVREETLATGQNPAQRLWHARQEDMRRLSNTPVLRLPSGAPYTWREVDAFGRI